MSPTTAAPFAGNKPTLPERCPLHAPGNRHRTEGKLLTTLLQRPGARGGGNKTIKQKQIKGTFSTHFSRLRFTGKQRAQPVAPRPHSAPPARDSGLQERTPRHTHTPSGNRCALPNGKATRHGASRSPAPPHGVEEGQDALTQVTSGLCRNSSTSCDTVTSMLSRGRAAQSGSGSRRRARETKAGREPTVLGCCPARPGRARGWGRGGEGWREGRRGPFLGRRRAPCAA